MPVKDLIPYLKRLDERETWRHWEVPPEITDDILSELDHYRLIELQLWSRSEVDGVTPVRNWRTWYVVRDRPGTAGTLAEILRHPMYQGEFAPEFRLSSIGADWLLRERASEGDQNGKRQGGAGAAASPEEISRARRVWRPIGSIVAAGYRIAVETWWKALLDKLSPH